MAQPLSAEQCEILGALLDPAATVADRTTDLVARRVNMSPRHVASRLAELQARSPPLARLAFDESWSVQTWLATPAGREAYREGCPRP
jgi:hypothetical protein